LRALLLPGACLLAIAPFFWWGSASGHDFEFHMNSWMEVLAQWKHGIVYPRWAALAHWGFGEARFLFYPPASWTLGAALGAALPWPMVPGAYCWIALMLAGTAMYRLARQWLAPRDALFAALFYALNPYHLLIVYWRSAYAELLASALLPLLLLCVLRLFPRESEPVRPILGLSLTLAAAWLTNVPAAVMIHYSAAGLVLVLTAREAVRARSWSPLICRPLLRTTLAVVLGAGLASFYLVPAIYEQKWVDLTQVLSPGVRPQDNFLFTNTADPDHNRFNLLVSMLALAEIGALLFAIWASWQKKPVFAVTPGSPVPCHPTQSHAPWMLISAWGLGSAFLMLSLSNLFWQHLPKLRFAQLPFRWLLCLNAALAMLLAMAAKRWTSRLLVPAVLLGVLIAAGHRTQPPWWDTADDIREMTDAFDDETGYEGIEEYVPAGADLDQLNKSLPRISDEAGAPVPARILAWLQTEKHFVVHASRPENLDLHLFNYPAWQVTVNGRSAPTETAHPTGILVIPILEGSNDVWVRFRRTLDRTIGNAISGFSLILLAVVWIRTRPKLIPPKRKDNP